MSEYAEHISDEEKIRISSDFIKHAPPGEFIEVFTDVRILLDNDSLLKQGINRAIHEYNIEQFTPCKLEGEDTLTLVTKHGLLPSGEFVDPRLKKKFSYDHLRRQPGDVSPYEPDSRAEPWRSAVDNTVREYVEDHYPDGVCTVYGKSADDMLTLTVCIEDHKFQPGFFWNGRWRSEWMVTFNPDLGGTTELKGLMRVQVHYYEDGNVQLASHREVKQDVKVSDAQGTAKEILSVISKIEEEYESAITLTYSTMSDTTFKALRRQLPITRTKIDWNKIVSYRIGAELAKS